MEKLSSTTSIADKEESLSPNHRLLSGYSYTNINAQSKDLTNECVLKCTCNSISNSYVSLKSPKPNQPSKDKLKKSSKITCDAATSPNHFQNHQKSPQCSSSRLSNNNKQSSISQCNELFRISDEKRVINKISPSPKRLVTTRNAATSPNLDIRKHTNTGNNHIVRSPELVSTSKSHLEKSNSLGEAKPNRLLRTTRSLSPRPPIRHQHSIMVSDENDIVSVKVSPNGEFDIEPEDGKDMKNSIKDDENVVVAGKQKHKAQSEQTSPNLSNFDTAFTYEKSINNRSTGCLVYVPSDPWLKMSELEDYGGDDIRVSTGRKKDKAKKISKLTSEVRSLSRGNLEPLDKDPWIWRKPQGNVISSNSNQQDSSMKRSPKQNIYRQAKSFSITKFDLSDISITPFEPEGKNLVIEETATKNSSSSKSSSTSRPKLQRSKSPVVFNNENGETSGPFHRDVRPPCTCNSTSEKPRSAVSSPRKDDLFLQHQQKQLTANNFSQESKQNKSLLNIINPNLLQARHSFSSISSQKDDELQLNIRRLSEQIKHNPPPSPSASSSAISHSNAVYGNNVKNSTISSTTGAASGADFSDYLKQFRCSEAQKIKQLSSRTSNNSGNNNSNTAPKSGTDTVLETTC